jgi:protease IV
MSDEIQKSNQNKLETTVHKIFRHQQRQKYWQIAKFIFITLLISGIGFSFLRQMNRSFTHLTKAASTREGSANKKHIALIDLRGEIVGSFDTARLGTADTLIPLLRQAFKAANTAAIVLRINSPGGSGVQSSQIYTEIRYLRTKYPKIPIYAVCEESCVSGAYYIATACDTIYASAMSAIGSIGVRIDSFGYAAALQKLGIERRLITAGNNKGMLDPYSPLKEEDVSLIKGAQAELHQIFIEDVQQGRGDRLKVEKNADELFSGRVWTGQKALALGLVDALGNLDTIARKLKLGIVDYTPQPDWLLFQLRKVAGLQMSMSTLGEGVTAGLIPPLLGLLHPLRGFWNPGAGLV